MTPSRPTLVSVRLLLACLPLCACAHTADATIPLERAEREVAENELPAPALAALRRAADGRTIARVEREERGAFVAYEGEWRDGAIEREATVLADGGLLESAHDLTDAEIDALPAAVQARIAALRAGGGVVTVSRREFVFYDIDVVRGDEQREYLVRPDGADAATPR